MSRVDESPGREWVLRLRPGDRILLPKEGEEATVEFAFRLMDSWGMGKICLRRANRELQSWYVDTDGCGVDLSVIMLPLEGNLASESEHVLTRLDGLFELLSKGTAS